MRLFHREEITVHCAFRGAALTVPTTDRLLDDCAPEQQHRLRRRLEKAAVEDQGWRVEWRKVAAEALRPHDIVAVLRCDEIVVELACAQRGVLAETLVAEGERAPPGMRLARLRKAPPPAPPLQSPPENRHDIDDLLRHFVARQRSDAETIKRLAADLAEYQQMADRLSSEVHTLRAGRLPGGTALPDLKFKRLKHEFSKRFHPDALPLGDAERAFRELVFREFWPILEEIDRS
jgi:hypothetical protein